MLAATTCLVLPTGCGEKETPGAAPRITEHGVGLGYEGY